MSDIQDLNDSSFPDAVRATEFSIVDVYAAWCGSCRMFAPTFKDVAAANPDIGFFKIDGEKNPAFCEQVPVDNLPFVAVFHNGKFVGGQSTTKKEALEEVVGLIRGRKGT